MKVAGYARVSTNEQDFELQIESIRKYAKMNDYDVVEIFREKVSGKKKDRPEHTRMMSMATKKKFDMVVVTRLDRFGRSTVDLMMNLEKLKELKISFICIEQNLDTSTQFGSMFLKFLAIWCEYERDLIRDRTSEGLKRAREKGKICHRPRKELDVDQIVKLYNEGKGLSLKQLGEYFDSSPATIRTRLRERGVDTSK
jgi:DNA invertase Pin-like site-specific DNA recombinase